MAWERTYTVSRIQGISGDQIWKIWTDVNKWHTWDADIEWAKMESPFEKESTFFLGAIP